MRIRATIEQGELSSAAEVVQLTTHEGLSELYDLEVQFVSENPDLDLDKMIWSSARVVLEDLETATLTQLSGIVEEAEFQPVHKHRFVYRLRLRPRLHGLAYRVRTRIFQEKDVKEVVTQVLKDAGVPDDAVEWKTSRSYPKREICVQYRESELAFVQRLLEEEGIFFFFRHDDAGEVLVLGDEQDVLAPEGEVPVLPLLAKEDAHGLSHAVVTCRLVHDAVTARDWNWEMPSTPLHLNVTQDGSLGLERYEYPGGYLELPDGTRRFGDRLDAYGVDRHLLEASCNVVGLQPGSQFSLVDAFPVAGDHRVISLERRFESYQPAQEQGPAGSYSSKLRATPADTPFRPARLTPRPRVSGKENAVVVGPSGEEIHVDQYGRVKLHFYWDREGSMDDHASCWVRVQQFHTSGSMLLPRVGWEVSVGFLDGDPDRPVVLQKLYNQETMPPYALPDNHSQMSLQSSSSPGGGGTNELRMQDGSGGMELFLHASKDLSTSVGHDLIEEVKVDSQAEVGVAFGMRVGVDQTLNVGATQKLSVTTDWTESTVGDKTINVGPMDDWGVTKNHSVTIEGTRKEKVGGVMNVLANEVTEKFNATCERTVGAAFALSAVTDFVESVGGKKTELVGGAKAELISKAKEETIKTAKALTVGLLINKIGGDVAVSAKGALAHTVNGPWAEKCGEDFIVTGSIVRITAPAGISFKVGGTKLDAKAAKIKVKASEFGAGGKMKLKLTGKINYKP